MMRSVTKSSRFFCVPSLERSLFLSSPSKRNYFYSSHIARYRIRPNIEIIQFRSISEESWAAEDLKKKGEKLEPISPDAPKIEYSDELINSPSEKVKKLCEEYLSLTIVESHQLMKLMQKRLGLSDSDLNARLGGGGGGGGGGSSGGKEAEAEAPAAAAAPAKVKDVFDIKLTVVDQKAKIKIIKEVRTITGLGLKEAKDLVESAPAMVKTGLKKDEADKFLKMLTDAGATAELL